MGLLDGLFAGSSGGGLLDFLRNNAMNQQMAGGLPSDQAQYTPITMAPSPVMQANQPSPLDNAQWPQGPIGAPSQRGLAQPSPLDTAQWPQGPIGAPSALPQNAQPTQGQLPMQPPQPQGQGFGDNIMAGLNNLNSGGNPITMLANVASGFATGQRYDRAGIAQQQQNQTARFLESKGMEPAMARAVVSDPNLLRAVLPQVMGIGGQTDDIKEFERANRDPAFAKYMESKRAGAGEVGLNPVWGEDGKGNPVLGQLNKRGEFIQTKLPPGVTPSKGVDKVDLGTEWGVISKVNGQLVGKYPKDIVGKESAEKVGQAQGVAKVALPAAEKTTARAVRMLDELESHRGFSDGVGFIVGRLPALTPGAADFRERVEQVDAMVFGDAVEVMRGLGALTDKEGPKVTAARARLKTAKSEEDFKTAIKDIRDVFRDGIENMRQKAGATEQGGQFPQAPAATAGGLPTGWSVKVR